MDNEGCNDSSPANLGVEHPGLLATLDAFHLPYGGHKCASPPWVSMFHAVPAKKPSCSTHYLHTELG